MYIIKVHSICAREYITLHIFQNNELQYPPLYTTSKKILKMVSQWKINDPAYGRIVQVFFFICCV